MPTSYEIVEALRERYKLGDLRLDEYLAARYDDVLLWAERNLTDYELQRLERLAMTG